MNSKKLSNGLFVLASIIFFISHGILLCQMHNGLLMKNMLEHNNVFLKDRTFNSNTKLNSYKDNLFRSIPFLSQKLNSELLIDSLVSISTDTAFQKMRSIYTYDDNNRLTIYNREIEDEGIQKYDQSATLTYNITGNLESLTVVGWRDDGNWGNDYKMIFSYDNKGNEIEELYQEWDVTSASWIDIDLSQFTYDQNNNLILELYSEWYNGNWENYGKVESSFDSNNNQILQILYWIVNDNWVPNYKLTWNYNSDNYLVEEFKHDWDTQTNSYKNDYWAIHTLDQNNREVAEIVLTWNSVITDWENFTQDLFTYDESGNNVNKYRYMWKNNDWVPDFERNLVYSKGNLLSVEYFYTWNGTSWNEGRRIIFSYDEQGNVASGNHEIWDGNQWKKGDGYLYLPKYYGIESFMAGLYTLRGNEFNVYYQELTDIDSGRVINNYFALFQNYPNPFNPTTIIKYSVPNVVDANSLPTGRQVASTTNVQLIVYDVLGREVKTLVNKKQKPGNYKVNFNASEFSSGVYFYRLKTRDITITKKMIYLE